MDIANVTIDLCQPSPNQYFGDWILNRTFPGKRRFLRKAQSTYFGKVIQVPRGALPISDARFRFQNRNQEFWSSPLPEYAKLYAKYV